MSRRCAGAVRGWGGGGVFDLQGCLGRWFVSIAIPRARQDSGFLGRILHCGKTATMVFVSAVSGANVALMRPC